MATTRTKSSGPQYRLLKGTRPKYLFELLLLVAAISLLLLGYRFYFLSDSSSQDLCSQSLKSLCQLSSEQISNCKMTDACEKENIEVSADIAPKYPLVTVEVFYEVLCPDSKDFILDQLHPTVQKIGSIMNVSLVPYGKASERKEGDEYVFTCQHGSRECKGNMIQTCTIHLLKGSKKQQALNFIQCMEASRESSTAGPPCAKELGIDFKEIDACSSGKLGNQLQHEMARRTDALNPRLIWVPWIVINGAHTEELQSRSLTDLKSVVCSSYTGPRPPACDEKLRR